MNATLVSNGKSGTTPQPCLLCASTEYSIIKKFPGGVVVGECNACGLIYTPIRHAQPDSLLFGNTLEQLEVVYRPIVNKTKRHFRESNFKEYLRLIQRHLQSPHPRLLDVGCAHGFFGAMAERSGFSVTGVEPSPSMGDFAETVLGLNILRGILSEVNLEDSVWDVITFTDSAEYIPSLLSDLKRIKRHLSESGIVFLKVPNGDYFRLRYAMQTRFGLRIGGDEPFGPPLRVAHYTNRTIRRLVEDAGLEVIEVGAPTPTHSTPWLKILGLHLEIEPPWYLGLAQRLVRSGLNLIGRAESFLLNGRNHFSPSIYVLARNP